jgi:hypothetical protein
MVLISNKLTNNFAYLVTRYHGPDVARGKLVYHDSLNNALFQNNELTS